MSDYTYIIDDAGALWFYDGINPEPFMYQPTWPNSTPWGKGEAKKWAEQAILSLTDHAADFAGDSPEQPLIQRQLVLNAEEELE